MQCLMFKCDIKNLVTIELFKVGEALDGDDDDVASAPPNDHFMTQS